MNRIVEIIIAGVVAVAAAGYVLAEQRRDHGAIPGVGKLELHEGHDHDEREAAHQEPKEHLHRHSDEHQAGLEQAAGTHHDHHDHDGEAERGEHDHGSEMGLGNNHAQLQEGGHAKHDHAGVERRPDQHDDHGHADPHGHDEHAHEEEGISLSEQQRRHANIVVSEIRPRRIDYQIYAPGEIKANGYTSYVVSPRVDSVILKRHVELGSHVLRGQPLVTLFSAAVAAAQAEFRVNLAEWQRAKKLGRKAIGEKRYVAAQNNFIAINSQLKAFGLSEQAMQGLHRAEPVNAGEYTLVAATSGVVLSDDFHQGQRVESGSVLMKLADESKLWVEARISGQKIIQLPKHTPALVKTSGQTFVAKVTQEGHAIDPMTRTRVVRLLIDNENHLLHPGMFADVYIQFTTDTPVMALHESALVRSADGHWMVFVEGQPGEFAVQEIELGRMLGDVREIKGLSPGDRVVTEGAFFVASQQAKGGFDPHNH